MSFQPPLPPGYGKKGGQQQQQSQPQFQPYQQQQQPQGVTSPPGNAYGYGQPSYGQQQSQQQQAPYQYYSTQPSGVSPIMQHEGQGIMSDPSLNSSAWSSDTSATGRIMALFGTGGYPDEPPLLEELGVNFQHIKSKTLAVMNPLVRIDRNEEFGAGIAEDADIAGPLIFAFLYGFLLLMAGKVHFGYIYGVGMIGCIAMCFLLNLMVESGSSLSSAFGFQSPATSPIPPESTARPSSGGIDFVKTVSVLGYGMLPLTILAGLMVALRRGVLAYGLALLCVLWGSHAAATMFVGILGMQQQQLLVQYPIILLYSCFALMALF